MIIAAIESSGMTVSVAAAQEDRVIAEYSLTHELTHSQTLLPMLDEMLRLAGIHVGDLGAVAVSRGPGSYTGLRIGSATAKGIAMTLNIPIVSIPTLEGMAWNLFGTSGIVCPMLDARREQVFTAIYRMTADGPAPQTEQMALPVREIAAMLQSMQSKTGEPVYVLGDGAEVYRDLLSELPGIETRLVPIHLRLQRAASLAAAAFGYIREGKTETAFEHAPDYLRKSQAEQERERKRTQADSSADSSMQ